MAEVPSGASHRQELVDVIRQVRHRWRMKLLVRGGIVIIAGALLALALASLGLQQTKFSPAWVTGLRIVTWAVFAVLVALWLFRPLRRRANDQQVALYIEEYEPSLQAAILAAVDVGALDAAGARPEVPPAIVERMVEQAAEKARAIEGGRAIGRRPLKRYAVVLGSVAAAALLLLIFGPEFLKQGASALLVVTRNAEAASPYAITVRPGDITIPRGSDQMVMAKLAGFRSSDVALWIKPDGAPKYDRVPLVASADPMTFEGMLFHVGKPIDYYVEADGVRSPDYHMKIVELPAVDKLELEYVYPAYTGLPSQKVESGGDVAALRGTEVRLRITPTMASPAGQVQLDPGSPSSLTAQSDGTLTGSFKMDKDGFYQIELDGPHGEKVIASPKYTVDVINDLPPTVSFEKPKRDISANPIEEVSVQARADDDYGVKELDLIYSVNGGDEKTVTLYGKGAKALPQVSAGHTIYLEELGVKPGDFVSYYAKAYDNDTVQGPKSASSDIYFVKILPFNQNFHQAQSQGGGGGGGGGNRNNQAGALSEQERQIISATFNVERDRPKTPADKFKENTVFIGLSQSKLREQLEELIQQMQQRLGNDEKFRQIAEILPKAAAEMKNAEGLLQGLKTKDALAPEQRALKHLQDAEQLYDLIVSQGGGGGGGGGGQMAQELADLFQLELDRQANQYETAQRAAAQSANQQIDDLADKLKELARRQLAQAEQQRQLGQRGSNSGSGGGSSQRQLADEAEQAARQLEQLRRQLEQQGQQRQDLADASRRLQDAANAMRQAAAAGQNGAASAQQALQQLQEASRLLQQNSSERVADQVKDAQRKADELAKEQRDVAQQVAGLDQAGDQKDNRIQQLRQQKTDMRNQVGALEQQLNQLSRQTLTNNARDASRKLQEAASSIRDQMIKEKIDYSSEAMSSGSEYSRPIENEIGSNLDALRQKVGEAASASDKADQGQGLSRALDQAASLLHGTEALNEQLNQRLGQGNQQGQQGDQQNQQGDQQSQGRQGQQGQGQQGQQGQGQQGQQGQGQQGQQGQGQQAQGQGQGQGRGQGQGQGQGDRQGQGGRQNNQQQNGGGGPIASGPPGGGNVSGTPRPLSTGDARDFRDQARQLANNAQDLRQLLQASGATTKDLQTADDIVRALHAMDADRSNDPRVLQGLAATALDKLSKFEWDLRKRIDTSNDQLFLSGSDEVPANYKDLIEQYYRALSKKAAGGKGGGGGQDR